MLVLLNCSFCYRFATVSLILVLVRFGLGAVLPEIQRDRDIFWGEVLDGNTLGERNFGPYMTGKADNSLFGASASAFTMGTVSGANAAALLAPNPTRSASEMDIFATKTTETLLNLDRAEILR
jgi:hypothetical protein